MIDPEIGEFVAKKKVKYIEEAIEELVKKGKQLAAIALLDDHEEEITSAQKAVRQKGPCGVSPFTLFWDASER